MPTTSGLVVLPTGELDAATQSRRDSHEDHIRRARSGHCGEDLTPRPAHSNNHNSGRSRVPATDADGATPFDIGGAGRIEHAESGVTPDTYPKVIVDKYGHVQAARTWPPVTSRDFCGVNHRGTPTTSGTPEQGFTNEKYTLAIADQSISRRHFSDISIAYIQESLNLFCSGWH